MKGISFLIACFMASAVLALGQPINDDTEEPSRIGRQAGWSRDFTIAGFSGRVGVAPAVFDFARGPDGSVLATGYFQWVGGRPVDPIVQLDEGGWQPVREDWGREVPQSGFTAIAASDTGELALSTYGGRFGGAVEIWLATATGVEVIGDLTGLVRSMVWFEGELWVGGYFLMEETGLTHLAVWDGATWSSPPGGPADGAVYRLSVSQGRLLMAGAFTGVGGTDARRVAEWDGTDWRAYDMDVGRVYAIARTASGELVAGGNVSGGLVRWTGAGWEAVGGGVFFEVWEGAVSGVVSDVVMHQGDLYVTGCFTHVSEAPPGPGSIRAASVARWTGSQWESLDDGSQRGVGSAWAHPGACGFEFGPFPIWDVQHQRLFSDGERVLLGGWFPGVAGVPSQSIVSFDGHEWMAVGRSEDGLSGSSEAIAVGGPRRSVHVLGYVSHAGTTPATSGIFRYDGGRRHGRWTAIGDSLPSDVDVCDDLAVDRRGRVFVACAEASEPWIPVVLRLDGESWVRLEPLPVFGPVEDMRFDARGRLWVAGGITGFPDEDVPDSGYIARWDGDTFTIVEDGFDSIVRRIAFPPTGSSRGPAPDLIAAGKFTHIGSGAYTRIARLSDGQWQGLGSGLSTEVLALAWGRDAIYASTEFTYDPEIERLLLARWDGTEWDDVATPENGMPPPVEGSAHSIYDLLTYRGHVIAVGNLWPESGPRQAFVYDERRGRVSPLGGGLNAMVVTAVARSRNELWFAGPIAEAGFGETRVPSVGVARYRFRHRPAVPLADRPDIPNLTAPAGPGIDD